MAMRWTLLAVACLAAACATANYAGTPIADWAGAYGNPQPPFPKEDPNDDGEGLGPAFYYRAEDILEIRPTGPTRAQIDLVIFYHNGHQCAVAGPADLEGGRLVYRETNEYGPCEISISRETNRGGEEELVVRAKQDEGSGACYIYCGANARLATSIRVSTRHALPAKRLGGLME
jgi:hypothetical protein